MRPVVLPCLNPSTSHLNTAPILSHSISHYHGYPRPRIARRRPITTSATSARVHSGPKPITNLPKLIVSPGSQHHNSLPTFLEYASRVNLAPDRTVYVGTHYEYIAALSLLRLGFSLLRTGKKSDAGIDLIGHWILPQLHEPIPVVIQCKARKEMSCAPRHIRELEGAFRGVPSAWRRNTSVLGLLVTTQNATRGVLQALGASARPMGFLKVTKTGMVEQFLWNRAAGERGLEGLGVTLRYTPKVLVEEKEKEVTEQGGEGNNWELPKEMKRSRKEWYKDTGTMKDIVLTWMGEPIFPERERLSEETCQLVDTLGLDEDLEVEERLPRKRKTAVKATAAKKVVRERKSTKESTTKKVGTKSVTKTVTKKAATKTATKQATKTGTKKAGASAVTKKKTTTGKSSSRTTSNPVTAKQVPKTSSSSTKAIELAQGVTKRRGRPPGSKNKKTLELLASQEQPPSSDRRP
ncbi:hypothetical protein BU24DRAFT_427590 [Aaosphaeria arxii CBS 175.79]|uniref:Restriction endonuclease type IV Mrr domain-containing protein n=1 Tax=Aaosphaeria arxii CBS 175.79 TaxID=1450172 RepID=A0A6A5XCB7_9PLEO|nr:uncharacterized protein BU24DRAFT_427590 [Aaosphaeria arxii CBS 175.79]KAF2010466.1 hypothetical protein BU24DRAFT_427590 [Aaosphaeria arxii CBS 175.79]